MKEIEVGAGDMTTESVVPYALHVAGESVMMEKGVFSGREVIGTLLQTSGNQVKVNWMIEELHGKIKPLKNQITIKK